MGDLKVGEAFEDRVYIVDSSGAAKTGLAPTCTIIDESGNRSAGTVAEMASGWYKVTDFTPDAAGTWCLEWAVAGAYVIQYPNKLFKVGGGTLADIETELTFQHQPITAFNKTSGVAQNVFETLLDTTLNCKIFFIQLYQKNDEAAAKTLKLKTTIDGTVITTGDRSCNNNTQYLWHKDYNQDTWYNATTTGIAPLYYNPLEARSVKIEACVSATPGTNQELHARIVFAKR